MDFAHIKYLMNLWGNEVLTDPTTDVSGLLWGFLAGVLLFSAHLVSKVILSSASHPNYIQNDRYGSKRMRRQIQR